MKQRLACWLKRSDFTVASYENLRDLFAPPYPKTPQAKAIVNAFRAVANQFWDVVIVDESHYMKNHGSDRARFCKKIKAGKKVALTGTPVDGRPEELHSIMEFLDPSVLGSKAEFFRRHIVQDGRQTAGYIRLDEIREKMKPYMIRRTKAEVLKDLPPKTYLRVPVILPPDERSAYDKIKGNGAKPVTEALKKNAEQAAIAKVQKSRMFCNCPWLVSPVKSGAKFDALEELLDEVVVGGKAKTIVFSSFTTVLDEIEKLLSKMNLTFLRIDGSTPSIERQDICKKFNTDPKWQVLIGSDAMSTGLNIQGAEYVINYDSSWQPAIMRQREDRAHRANTTHPVFVVNLVCLGTIEEGIESLLSAKDKVTNEILDGNGDAASKDSTTFTDLEKLV